MLRIQPQDQGFQGLMGRHLAKADQLPVMHQGHALGTKQRQPLGAMAAYQQLGAGQAPPGPGEQVAAVLHPLQVAGLLTGAQQEQPLGGHLYQGPGGLPDRRGQRHRRHGMADQQPPQLLLALDGYRQHRPDPEMLLIAHLLGRGRSQHASRQIVP